MTNRLLVYLALLCGLIYLAGSAKPSVDAKPIHSDAKPIHSDSPPPGRQTKCPEGAQFEAAHEVQEAENDDLTAVQCQTVVPAHSPPAPQPAYKTVRRRGIFGRIRTYRIRVNNLPVRKSGRSM